MKNPALPPILRAGRWSSSARWSCRWFTGTAQVRSHLLVWLGAAVVLCGAATYTAVDASSWLIALYFFPFVAFLAWYGLYRHIQEIRLSDSGVCEFRTLLRPRRIEVREIIAMRLKENVDDPPTMIVQHEGGKIGVSAPADDGRDLVRRLVTMNSGIEVDQILLHPE